MEEIAHRLKQELDSLRDFVQESEERILVSNGLESILSPLERAAKDLSPEELRPILQTLYEAGRRFNLSGELASRLEQFLRDHSDLSDFDLESEMPSDDAILVRDPTPNDLDFMEDEEEENDELLAPANGSSNENDEEEDWSDFEPLVEDSSFAEEEEDDLFAETSSNLTEEEETEGEDTSGLFEHSATSRLESELETDLSNESTPLENGLDAAPHSNSNGLFGDSEDTYGEDTDSLKNTNGLFEKNGQQEDDYDEDSADKDNEFEQINQGLDNLLGNSDSEASELDIEVEYESKELTSEPSHGDGDLGEETVQRANSTLPTASPDGLLNAEEDTQDDYGDDDDYDDYGEEETSPASGNTDDLFSQDEKSTAHQDTADKDTRNNRVSDLANGGNSEKKRAGSRHFTTKTPQSKIRSGNPGTNGPIPETLINIYAAKVSIKELLHGLNIKLLPQDLKYLSNGLSNKLQSKTIAALQTSPHAENMYALIPRVNRFIYEGQVIPCTVKNLVRIYLTLFADIKDLTRYKGQPFINNETPKLEWAVVAVSPGKESFNRDFMHQNQFLRHLASSTKAPSHFLRRRTLVEVVYDLIVGHLALGDHWLHHTLDWTSSGPSTSEFICVSQPEEGIRLRHLPRTQSHPALGVCPNW